MSTTHRPPDDVAPGPSDDTTSSLDRTQIYDVLSNERRSMVLDLLSAEEPRDLGSLAELIAAEETGEDPPPRKKRTSVYVTLHQTHLPKLAELDVVEYDDREKVVSLGARAPAVLAQREDASTTSAPAETDGTSADVPLAMVLSGLGLAGASEFGLPVIEAVSAGAIALGTLVVLLAVFAYRVGRDGVEIPAQLSSRVR
jgi:hypothetical protein